MILKTMPKRSIYLRRMLMFCFVVAGVLTAISGSSAGICQNASIATESNIYGEMIVCLPEEITVEGESMPAERAYNGGSEVALSILVDGNRVGLHLLYPCLAPETELAPADLKPYLEGYNPVLAEAMYNESIPGPALWGQIGNQMLIGYQPVNRTIALLLIDMNMSESMMTTFLGNLSILVYEEVAPASNCQDTTSTAAEAIAASEPAVEGNETSVIAAVETTVQTPEEKIATGREKMLADTQAAQARMKELMNR